MSDKDIEKAVAPFWHDHAITIGPSAVALRLELDALRARVAELEAELSSVLTDWNALVRAVGSPTHGGAVGHANALRAENARLRAALEAAPEPKEVRRTISHHGRESSFFSDRAYADWFSTTRREALDG